MIQVNLLPCVLCTIVILSHNFRTTGVAVLTKAFPSIDRPIIGH